MQSQLNEQIKSRQMKVGIIGLGYVGLPLALEFTKADFQVLGFDVDPKKCEALKIGETYIRHISSDALKKAFQNNGPAEATIDFSRVQECGALIICVPTPLTKYREPDLTYIEKTAQSIAPFLQKGQLISLESTTYPGTTEEVLIPILEEKSNLKAGTDFFVAYSPEREDPNNQKFTTKTIPKVVGGLNQESLDLARALYNCVICQTVPVSSCRAAEATKLMENIFRCINIALVNELKAVFMEMSIDIWEVVEAASTKPFGFMPFYPGPGLGGHCIPIDPFYLTWKAKEYGIPTKFIELAGEINTGMPDYVINRVMLALNSHGKSLKGSRILLIGLAYKKNVDDQRESPSYVLWKKLAKHGATVEYFDPYCPQVYPSREHPELGGIQSRTREEISNGNYDLGLIATAHDQVDHDALAAMLPIVVDTRNVCRQAKNVFKA